MHIQKGLASQSTWVLFILIGCLAVAGPLLSTGCGDEEGETIVINLQPWGLGFDSTNQLYLSERAFYVSVLKFTNSGVQYNLTGLILPPYAGGFSPWGVEVATGTSDDFLFLTDVSGANDHPRLLAVTEFGGETGLDSLLEAQTEGPAGDEFTDLRGVASLALGGDLFRVFVADGSRVLAFRYDATAKAPTFTFEEEIAPNGPCTAFIEPYGLAVDPADPALYVVDMERKSLYRFSNIEDDATPEDCDAEMNSWTGGAFDDPRGAAFGETEIGDPPVLTEVIVVANSGNNDVATFTWSGAAFVPSDPPNDFEPVPGAAPFDLAFDLNNDLWVTYPESSAIGGPKLAATP